MLFNLEHHLFLGLELNLNVQIVLFIMHIPIQVLFFNEFLHYSIRAKAVTASANRALGLVIAKCKVLGGVTYHVFTNNYMIVIEYTRQVFEGIQPILY